MSGLQRRLDGITRRKRKTYWVGGEDTSRKKCYPVKINGPRTLNFHGRKKSVSLPKLNCLKEVP